MKFGLMIFLFSTVLLLSGCSQYPPMTEVHKGMGMAQVIDIMGDRGRKQVMAQGMEGQSGWVTWIYPHGRVRFYRNICKEVLYYNDDGELVPVPELSDSETRENPDPSPKKRKYPEFRFVPAAPDHSR